MCGTPGPQHRDKAGRSASAHRLARFGGTVFGQPRGDRRAKIWREEGEDGGEEETSFSVKPPAFKYFRLSGISRRISAARGLGAFFPAIAGVLDLVAGAVLGARTMIGAALAAGKPPGQTVDDLRRSVGGGEAGWLAKVQRGCLASRRAGRGLFNSRRDIIQSGAAGGKSGLLEPASGRNALEEEVWGSVSLLRESLGGRARNEIVSGCRP